MRYQIASTMLVGSLFLAAPSLAQKKDDFNDRLKVAAGDACLDMGEYEAFSGSLSDKERESKKRVLGSLKTIIQSDGCFEVKSEKGQQKWFLQASRPKSTLEGKQEDDGSITYVRVAPSKEQATLLFTDNRVKGTQVGKAKFGLAFSPNPPTAQAKQEINAFSLKNIVYWTDFDGTFDDVKGDKTLLRLGAQYELRFLSEFPRYQHVSIAPYLLTDLKFGASGFGLEASWTPRHSPWKLTEVGGPFNWTFDLVADARFVNKGGETGIADGKDVILLTPTLGARYRLTDSGLPTAYIQGSYAVAYDLISGATDDLLSLGLSVPLDPEERVSVLLSYDKGTDLQTKDAIDKTEIRLTFTY